MYKLGFIGMGNMSSAIIKGIVNSEFINSELICGFDISPISKENAKALGVTVLEIEEVIKQSEIIVIGVKPQVVEKVINEVKDILKNKTIISMVLGYSFEKYNELLDESTKHLTFMPNTPILVSEGMTLIESKHNLKEEDFKFVLEMFNSCGEVSVVDSSLMKVGGALSGCGPAFIYQVIEALADGAVYHGMPRELAYKLASQTILGSGKMQIETHLHPGLLKDQVTSPAGSTIRGVKALEDHGIRSAFIDAIDKAMSK